MMRTKGEAGSGNIVEAVRHMRSVQGAIRRLTILGRDELMAEAKNLGAPHEIVTLVAEEGRLPVPNFAAGGIATPSDASLMMQLGAQAVFVGSGIFKSADPDTRARAIVRATTHYRDPAIVAEVSRGLGEAMHGIETSRLEPEEMLQTRGW
jgi:pyridoxal 5'-phosphate synthase pdxS subunit